MITHTLIDWSNLCERGNKYPDDKKSLGKHAKRIFHVLWLRNLFDWRSHVSL